MDTKTQDKNQNELQKTLSLSLSFYPGRHPPGSGSASHEKRADSWKPKRSRISCATRSPTATTKSCGGLKSKDCREHPANIDRTIMHYHCLRLCWIYMDCQDIHDSVLCSVIEKDYPDLQANLCKSCLLLLFCLVMNSGLGKYLPPLCSRSPQPLLQCGAWDSKAK